MTLLNDILTTHWRLISSLLAGALVGLACTTLLSLSLSTSFIIGWDSTILLYILNIIIMLNRDTMHEHLNSVKQSQFSVLSLIIISSFICVYSLTKQTQMTKNYQDWEFVLSISLTIGTIFTTWLMIQIIFAMHYAFLYFSQLQKGDALPIAFPEANTNSDTNHKQMVSPSFEDFFYCAVSIGTSAQTADTTFISTAGRNLATLHCVIAFAFNLVIIALMINILATYI
ncbi:DUF1345 domain-containing protein [Psychrobacter sp.]|uniref:DUF1345 domain-containing protein n=1 Tax=Psychrobacter sp. TaxID=56811 RepID=UPI0025D4F780|nr:DUF1345 domain-containing protein [Psychrobacter sp.]